MAHYGNNGHQEQGNGNNRDADRIDPGRIFVGGLSWQTTEEALVCHFEKYGKVNSAEIMRDKITGDPRGFGFVLFREDETIDEIMKDRPHEIDNKVVDVKRAQKAIPRTDFIRDKIARGIPPPNNHHHYHPRDAQDPRDREHDNDGGPGPMPKKHRRESDMRPSSPVSKPWTPPPGSANNSGGNGRSGGPPPSLADLCDMHVASPDRLSVVEPGLLRSYGGRAKFGGKVECVRCFESNLTVRAALSNDGHGRVLVVDGGGSTRAALLGDELAKLAIDNGWCGVILHGCVRDSSILRTMDLGVLATGTHPVRSIKTYPGERGVNVNFGGVEFVPGHWVYSDMDGVLVSENPIHLDDGRGDGGH